MNLTEAHTTSFDRVIDVASSDGPTVRGLVDAALAELGISTRRWQVERSWEIIDDRDAWAAVMFAEILLGQESWPLVLTLPAPCDDTARSQMPDGIATGDHPGLYVGQTLVPVTQLIAKPGWHQTVRPRRARLDKTQDGLQHRIAIIPDLGRGFRMTRSPSDLQQQAIKKFRAALESGQELTTYGFISANLRTELLIHLDHDQPWRWLDDPPDLSADELAHAQPYGPAHAELRSYGYTLLGALYRAIRRRDVVEQWAELRDRGQLDKISIAVAGQVQRAVLRFLRSELIMADDQTDSLARLERRQLITMFGPYGLRSPSRGNLDFRDLHPDWAGTICPLHTPESERIGLIRYAAADAELRPGPTWAGLSLSASLIPFLNHNDQARSVLAAKNLKQAVPLDQPQIPLVRTGAERLIGSLVATASDVALDESGTPHLALGVNLLTALTPWKGLNFEDAVVVSESSAEQLRHTARSRWRETVTADTAMRPLVSPGSTVAAGQPLAEVAVWPYPATDIVADQDGLLDELVHDQDRCEVRWAISASRPLAVGDKISNRHGAKGVVAAILPDAELPWVPALNRAVDMIANPLGVIRRLTIGQVLEMGVGLRALLTDQQPVTVGRTLDDRTELAAELAELGAPGGRLELVEANGQPMREPVLIGPQYVLKLTHTARSKISVRGREGPYAVWRQQPSSRSTVRGGRRTGAAQRLGEMELWALAASGANLTLREVLAAAGLQGGHRGTWQALLAHLEAAGLLVEAGADGRWTVRALADADTARWRIFDDDELHRIRLSTGADPDGPPNPVDEELPGLGEDNARHTWRAFALPELPPAPQEMEMEERPIAPTSPVHPWTGQPLATLPVLAPAFRTLALDDLNSLYARLGGLLAPPKEPAPGRTRRAVSGWEGRESQVKALRKIYADIFTALEQRILGKSGLLRRYLLGVSCAASARAVMVGDPDLPIEQIFLPPLIFDTLIGTDPDRTVLINRAPTLRPTNLVAVRAERWDHDAVALHPQLLINLAGDFDGDTVAVHRLPTAEARAEVWDRLRPARWLWSRADGSPFLKADLDLALGAFRLNRGPASVWLTECLGAPGSMVESDQLKARQSELWTAATGWSLSLLDLPAGAVSSGPLSELVVCGAIKPEVVTSLLVGVAFETTFNPLLPLPPVVGCLLDGLDDHAYSAGARPAVARLAEKKLLTPLAGALTKSLVEIAYETCISSVDCGLDTAPRDPLRCRSEDPCQACYGELPGTGGPPAIRERVGLLAAMLIGERGTQLSMKTFHTGSGGPLDVPELQALFGNGRGRALAEIAGAPTPVSLRTLLRTADDQLGALDRMTHSAVAGLSGAVAAVHVQVLLRQLWAAHAEIAKGPLAGVTEDRGRDPIVRATSRGSLRHLLDPRRPTQPRQRARLALMIGPQ